MLLPHKQEGFRHLLQVIDLRPALITGTLSLLHPLLDVDQQIEARLFMSLAAPASGMDHLPGNPVTDIVFRVSFSQGSQPDEPFLSGSFDRDLLSPLDLIPCHLKLM